MVPGISSQIFLPQRLTTGLLDFLAGSGAQVIELFARRNHFDYTDRQQMRELAQWFDGNGVAATLHAPLTSDADFSRHSSPNVNLVDLDKGRRIVAMDEVKRAIEAAEYIPMATCVLHLGLREDRWSEHVQEHSLVAVEHLKAFAAPLGVRLLLENLRNEIATPEHLLEILRIGHFDSCGICLDVGHAYLSDLGVRKTMELLAARAGEVHLHDNHGPDAQGDEHLWPASGSERPSKLGAGTLDWVEAYGLLKALPADTPGVLEIKDTQTESGDDAGRMAREVFSHWQRLREA